MTKQRKVVTLTRIVKFDGEYVVKAYDQGNNRFPEADYYTKDWADADETSRSMVNQSVSSPKSLSKSLAQKRLQTRARRKEKRKPPL